VQVAKVDRFKKQVDFCLAVEERKAAPLRPPASRPVPARPQPFPPRKKFAPFRPETKRPPSAPSGKPQWKDSQRLAARPGQSQRPDSRPGQSRREDSRASESKPMFRTSSSQLPTSQRPLLKSSGSSRFSPRRR